MFLLTSLLQVTRCATLHKLLGFAKSHRIEKVNITVGHLAHSR